MQLHTLIKTGGAAHFGHVSHTYYTFFVFRLARIVVTGQRYLVVMGWIVHPHPQAPPLCFHHRGTFHCCLIRSGGAIVESRRSLEAYPRLSESPHAGRSLQDLGHSCPRQRAPQLINWVLVFGKLPPPNEVAILGNVGSSSMTRIGVSTWANLASDRNVQDPLFRDLKRSGCPRQDVANS